MRILLSNDDGYFAPPIALLAEVLAPLAEVTVVAPERDRSGSSNSLTLDRPLTVRRAHSGFYLRERHAHRLRARRGDGAARASCRTSSSPASTTAPTWATTRSTPAPWPPRPKASCSAFRRSRSRSSCRAGKTSPTAGADRGRAGRALPGRARSAQPRAAQRQRARRGVRRAARRAGDAARQAPQGRAGRQDDESRAARRCTGSGAAGAAQDAGEGTDFHAVANEPGVDHAAAGGSHAGVRSSKRCGSGWDGDMTARLSGIGMTSQRTRLRMVERLREQGIRDEAVLAVMGGAAAAYLRRRGAGEPRLRRHVAAARLRPDHLQPAHGGAHDGARARGPARSDKVLEIGTGCGYQTAVLAKLAKQVYSIERLAALLEPGAPPPARGAAARTCTCGTATASLGMPQMAPFDAIVMTAAAARVPDGLVEQLKPGGRMVMPIATAKGQQLVRDRAHAAGLYRAAHGPGKVRAAAAGSRMTGSSETATRSNYPADRSTVSRYLRLSVAICACACGCSRRGLHDEAAGAGVGPHRAAETRARLPNRRRPRAHRFPQTAVRRSTRSGPATRSTASRSITASTTASSRRGTASTIPGAIRVGQQLRMTPPAGRGDHRAVEDGARRRGAADRHARVRAGSAARDRGGAGNGQDPAAGRARAVLRPGLRAARHHQARGRRRRRSPKPQRRHPRRRARARTSSSAGPRAARSSTPSTTART